MTSFINMMGTDRWSEADIVRRTESMIASEFPPDQEAIINRIVTAAAAGMYQMTETELAQVARYNAVCVEAREAGEAARADMALLAQALDHEAALQAKAAAESAIAAAQLVLDGAGDDALALVAQRAQSLDLVDVEAD